MGPITYKWWDERGLDHKEVWCGGRIDVRGLDGDEYYDGQFEIGLPVMRGEDWGRLTYWLRNLKTDDLWTFDHIIEAFEKENPKIVWAPPKLER